MSRYSDISYIMESDFKFGAGMMIEAERQRKRDEAYILYASVYPLMTPESFIPFEQFYKGDFDNIATRESKASSRGPRKQKDEILSMVDEMMKGK